MSLKKRILLIIGLFIMSIIVYTLETNAAGIKDYPYNQYDGTYYSVGSTRYWKSSTMHQYKNVYCIERSAKMPTTNTLYRVTNVINIYDGVHATDGYRTYYGNTYESGRWNAYVAYMAEYGKNWNGFHDWCGRQLVLWREFDVGKRILAR